MDRSLVAAVAFLDAQDPVAAGWACRLQYSDGHRESGPLDAGDDPLAALEAIVAAEGAEWAAGTWRYCGSDGGSYVWRA